MLKKKTDPCSNCKMIAAHFLIQKKHPSIYNFLAQKWSLPPAEVDFLIYAYFSSKTTHKSTYGFNRSKRKPAGYLVLFKLYGFLAQ